jgi:hypothetical protein
MSLITLSLKHGQTQEQARNRLEAAVNEVRKLFGALVQHVVWSTDRTQVRIDGAGFWVELVVDAESVHATGDIPMLGGLLGGPLAAGLKRIMQQTIPKQLR